VNSNNNIVYKICCKNCDAFYVGQTKRQLKMRINEHVKNINLKESKHSVIIDHIFEKNHTFDWYIKKKNFSLLSIKSTIIRD